MSGTMVGATAETWHEHLTTALEAHGVPGASLSIHDGEQTIECAAGVLNLRSGQPVTTDSLFQVGSITKLFAATLALALVEDGVLALDDRVLELLPELAFAPGIDPEPMTVAHLLTHTCGVESDNFADFGRGDDALWRFVASMAQLELMHEPGARFSYSNSGYSILGRIVEVISGRTYTHVLRQRVLEPLGLERATTFAEEAILYPTAVGHYRGADGPVPTRVWTASRGCEPEGLICATSGEILRLGLDHLRSHRGGGGLLRSATAHLVHDRAVPFPPLPRTQTHQGLGWAVYASAGGRVVGHDGSIMGQTGILRVDLERGTAVALLTNGETPAAYAIYCDLLDAGLSRLIGETPRMPDPSQRRPLSEHDAERLPGTYRRLNRTLHVARDADGLTLTVDDDGGLLQAQNDVNRIRDRRLVPIGDGVLAVEGVDPASPECALAWAEPDRKRGIEYVYFRGRLTRRVSP